MPTNEDYASEPMAWAVDTALNYTHVGDAKGRLLGLPSGFLNDKSMLACMHPVDAETLRGILSDGALPVGFSSLIIRYLCPQGAEVITELSGEPRFSDRGEMAGFQGTERCIAALAPQSHGLPPPRLEVGFALAPIAFSIIDRDLRLLAMNERYAALSGKAFDELMDTSVGDLYPPSFLKTLQDFIALDSGGCLPDHEVSIAGRDYIISVNGLPDASGAIKGMCVTHLDISRRKQLERELEAANRQLAEVNIKDYLTGAFNRRHFDETLEYEMARLARSGGSLCVAMLDVDHFKLFNDAYGHLAGDNCLAALANAVSSALHRPGDKLFRYGGEEFAIIMPNTSQANGIMVAQRVREAVSALNIPHRHSAYGHVTISIGVADIKDACARHRRFACEEVITTADRALYRAKSGGRNTVAFAVCDLNDDIV